MIIVWGAWGYKGAWAVWFLIIGGQAALDLGEKVGLGLDTVFWGKGKRVMGPVWGLGVCLVEKKESRFCEVIVLVEMW